MVALGAALLLASSTRARADAPVLRWVRAPGAETCVAQDELAQQLAEQLIADGVASSALTIEGIVAPSDGGYLVQLRASDAEHTVGVRELRAVGECAQLTSSLVLVLALMVELGARDQVAPSASLPAPPSAQAPQEPPELPPALLPATPLEQPRYAMQLHAALALALGFHPGVGVGPTLGARVFTPWWLAFALRFGYWPGGSTQIRASDARFAEVDFHAIDLDAGLCLPALRGPNVWLTSCWGPAWIMRKAHVRGLGDGADSLRSTVGASAGVQLAYAVDERWLLSVEAALFAFRRRDRYAFEGLDGDVETLYRTPRFAALFSLGIGVRP